MEKIKSVILCSINEYELVQKAIVSIFNERQMRLQQLYNGIDVMNYFYVKSHRSNVTEGNTTSIGEFTDLVRARRNKDYDYVVPNKAYDETFEITNLKKVYDFLKTHSKYNIQTLQRAHAILGEDIYKNNLLETRGKLKRVSNFVPFIFDGVSYQKYFIEPSQVKEKVNQLFTWWNSLDEDSEAAIFAKFIILQIELIAIHPFNDGNGRIARALSEAYLEAKGYIPYTPYSTAHKKTYQYAMGEYSITSLSSKIEAYCCFSTFILSSYHANIEDLLKSLDKVNEVTQVKIIENSCRK